MKRSTFDFCSKKSELKKVRKKRVVGELRKPGFKFLVYHRVSVWPRSSCLFPVRLSNSSVGGAEEKYIKDWEVSGYRNTQELQDWHIYTYRNHSETIIQKVVSYKVINALILTANVEISIKGNTRTVMISLRSLHGPRTQEKVFSYKCNFGVFVRDHSCP